MVRTVVLATRRLRRLQLIYTPREGTSRGVEDLLSTLLEQK
jgi:hypothetical protein